MICCADLLPLLLHIISLVAAFLAHILFCSIPFSPPALSTSMLPSGNLYRTACAFPSLDDSNGCQRGGLGHEGGFEGGELLNGWFCDPESTVSMSEVFAIDETLRRIYEQNRQNCVCAPPEESIQRLEIGNCWFRFGFAFVPELSPGPDSATAEQCAKNFEIGANNSLEESIEPFGRFLLPEKGNLFDAFSAFADNYARVLRQRWNLGECGEDILLLVVQRPPQKLSAGPLSSAHSRLFGPLPLIFLSFGPSVTRRLHADFGRHAVQNILLEANAQLQRDARPLFKVLSELLLRMETEVLAALAEDFAGSAGDGTRPPLSPTHPRHRHSNTTSRSHVPLWAWAVFGACGIAFGFMALGLFLIRTRTRRSATPAGIKQQQKMVSRRHWREGSQFGKDEQPPPTTYVNLVQLLMPHPKPPPVNMPQQV
uniref:Transmembrane protein n=1 Tax=Globodera rostochiensis TaxID=31243 RepID=A0A914GY82_GLORO